MKLKALASVAIGLALVASQASAAAAVSSSVNTGVTSGVHRATPAMKGSNKLVQVGGVWGFFYLGVFIALTAIFIDQAQKDDGKTSP